MIVKLFSLTLLLTNISYFAHHSVSVMKACNTLQVARTLFLINPYLCIILTQCSAKALIKTQV